MFYYLFSKQNKRECVIEKDKPVLLGNYDSIKIVSPT